MTRRAPNLERVVAAGAEAGRDLAQATGAERAAALLEMAEALERRAEAILHENHEDVVEAKRADADPRDLDVLLLDGDRIGEMAVRIRRLAALPDPIGGVAGGRRLGNGVDVGHRRVPVGLVAVVYEGAPHVTTDAAAMCLRTGNAAVLRGGTAARRTNRILNEVLEGALVEAGVPRAVLSMIGPDPEELERLLGLDALVDLLVARGGPAEVQRLATRAAMPVIRAPHGLAHVYVDAHADPDVAARVVMSLASPPSRTSTLAEAVLVHEALASAFGSTAVDALAAHGVETRLVPSLEAAVGLIENEGLGQLACVLSGSAAAISTFGRSVSAGCVLVNASPRVVDGEAFGAGPTLGIAAAPGAAGGPVTVAALTTTRLEGEGEGQAP